MGFYLFFFFFFNKKRLNIIIAIKPSAAFSILQFQRCVLTVKHLLEKHQQKDKKKTLNATPSDDVNSICVPPHTNRSRKYNLEGESIPLIQFVRVLSGFERVVRAIAI